MDCFSPARLSVFIALRIPVFAVFLEALFADEAVNVAEPPRPHSGAPHHGVRLEVCQLVHVGPHVRVVFQAHFCLHAEPVDDEIDAAVPVTREISPRCSHAEIFLDADLTDLPEEVTQGVTKVIGDPPAWNVVFFFVALHEGGSPHRYQPVLF